VRDEAGRWAARGPVSSLRVCCSTSNPCASTARARSQLLNDSKQLDRDTREELLPRRARLRGTRVGARLPAERDRPQRACTESNLRGLRNALWACQPADICLVDGFRLGPTAPEHRAVVDGDEKSAAIAAASIVAKVTRDRYMQTADALSIPPTVSIRTSGTSPLRTAPSSVRSGRRRSTGGRSTRAALRG